jgi:hypothetical protein
VITGLIRKGPRRRKRKGVRRGPEIQCFVFSPYLLLSFWRSKNCETWTTPLSVPSEKAISKKPGVKPESPPAPGDQKDGKAAPSVASYIFIAEKNPFHPDRKEFPIIAEPAKPEAKKPVVRPQVTLYGVTIVGDYRSASISYPGRSLQKGERRL